jgi:hypothetical protein
VPGALKRQPPIRPQPQPGEPRSQRSLINPVPADAHGLPDSSYVTGPVTLLSRRVGYDSALAVLEITYTATHPILSWQ